TRTGHTHGLGREPEIHARAHYQTRHEARGGRRPGRACRVLRLGPAALEFALWSESERPDYIRGSSDRSDARSVPGDVHSRAARHESRSADRLALRVTSAGSCSPKLRSTVGIIRVTG